MKNIITIMLILFTSFFAVSCEAIGDIFGAGVTTGVILVLLVIVVVIVIVVRLMRRK